MLYSQSMGVGAIPHWSLSLHSHSPVKLLYSGVLVLRTANPSSLSLWVVVLSIVAVKRVYWLIARRFAELGALHTLKGSLPVQTIRVSEARCFRRVEAPVVHADLVDKAFERETSGATRPPIPYGER